MKSNSIDARTLKKHLDEGKALLVDVREAHEHAREHIEGARLVPLSRFALQDFSGDAGKTAVFYCHSGARTNANARLFASKGFSETYTLSGGIMAWKAAGLPTKSARDTSSDARRGFFSRLF